MAQNESLKDLLKQLANDSAAMVRDEIALAVQGAREKVATLRRAAMMMAAGAALLLLALMSVCAALIIQLAAHMSPVLAALLVGVILAVIGVIAINAGSAQFKK